MITHQAALLEKAAAEYDRITGSLEGCPGCDVEALDAAFAILGAEQGWQPIETAPKDGSNVEACWPGHGAICPTRWASESHEAQPRPYWTHWGARIFGLRDIRNNQPTHWRPMPASPKEE